MEIHEENRCCIVRWHIRHTIGRDQNLILIGEGGGLGGWEVHRGVWLSNTSKTSSSSSAGSGSSCSRETGDEGEQLWSCCVSIPIQLKGNVSDSLEYRYVVVDKQVRIVSEEEGKRRVFIPFEGLLSEGKDCYVNLCDCWGVNTEATCRESLFSASAFRRAIYGQNKEEGEEGPVGSEMFVARVENRETGVRRLDTSVRKSAVGGGVTVRFALQWHCLDAMKESLFVSELYSETVGDFEHLPMEYNMETKLWEAEMIVDASAFPLDYVYRTVNTGRKADSEKKRAYLKLPSACPNEQASLIVLNDGLFRTKNLWRGFGIAVPVFSLRTESSIGVGDFRDLRQFIDLTSIMNGSLVQLLPVNDTCVYNNWLDSYPYRGISVFALHPLYLVVEELLPDDDQELPANVEEDIRVAKEELEGQEKYDYERALFWKMRIVKRVYDYIGRSAGLHAMEGFENFLAENAKWVKPYAAFKLLQRITGTSEHRLWGPWAADIEGLVARITSRDETDYDFVALHYFIQFSLHKQFKRARLHAEEKRVALMGDLPIGVGKWSVETFMHPTLFQMELSVGAPPDYFSGTGQNWGFPGYEWDEMKKDGYAWWRARLQHMSQYFHSYRIDHILGFFRIWSFSDQSVNGVLGHFSPSKPYTRAELESLGLYDIDRLVRPYITWALILAPFGVMAEEIAEKVFVETTMGHFEFSPKFGTESAIAKAFQDDGETCKKLLAIFQNVCLIADSDDPNHFYPRANLHETSSYANLSVREQKALKDLCEDYFYKRNDELWQSTALERLPALMSASDMLVHGEDLGMIPACVRPVLEDLGILGLRIQRMSATTNRSIDDPCAHAYLNVCSTSSHDTTTLRGWLNTAGSLEAFAEEFPNTTASVYGIVQQHLNSPVALCILPIQDVLQVSEAYHNRPHEEETINDPANAQHYWRYRMDRKISDILKDDNLIQTVRNMVEESGRGHS